MAAAMMAKLMTAVMNAPNRNFAPLASTIQTLLKSGLPKMAAMSGEMTSSTSAFTTRPKAAPMTTATARSTTLPRMMKSLKPLSMTASHLLES